MSKKNMKNSILTLENLVGLVLGLLIVLDIKVEQNIANLVNTPLDSIR